MLSLSKIEVTCFLQAIAVFDVTTHWSNFLVSPLKSKAGATQAETSLTLYQLGLLQQKYSSQVWRLFNSLKQPLPAKTIQIILISQIISKFEPSLQLIDLPSSTFLHPVTSKQLQSRLWRPFTFLIWREGYCSSQNYTVFASVMSYPVLYLPEFLLEQDEHNKWGIQPLHLLQHESTSVVNTPIPTSSWIFF